MDVSSSPRMLPDVVADGRPAARGCVDRVGMTGIETIVTLRTGAGWMRLPARVDAFVSLDDPEAKGIHMSRIVLAIEETFSTRDLTLGRVAELLGRMRCDQDSLNRSAELIVRVEYPRRARIPPLRRSGYAHLSRALRRYPGD